jgi:hypothetical protein
MNQIEHQTYGQRSPHLLADLLATLAEKYRATSRKRLLDQMRTLARVQERQSLPIAEDVRQLLSASSEDERRRAKLERAEKELGMRAGRSKWRVVDFTNPRDR